MVLPGGITGFYDRGDEPLMVTDLPAFRGHCHEAARRAGGRVVSVTNPYPSGLCRNFAIATLTLPGGEVAVLLNAHHPVIAFADPPGGGEVRLRFRDCPELAKVFDTSGVYQVVAAAELERPPAPDSLRELSDIEREQMAYWEPQRLGDVVFNWWD